MSELTLDQFLGHKTSNRGGKYLGKWKDSPTRKIRIWLSATFSIQSLWRHSIPRIVEVEKDGYKELKVWSSNLVCGETEEVLRHQNRLMPDGTRFAPPCSCGICKMVEHIRHLVDSGKLKWTAPVFQFSVPNPRECRTLYAGGLYGGFAKKNLSAAEKQELAGIGVSGRDAYQYSIMPRVNYVFGVIDNDNPEEVQIAIESALLGDKIKEVIFKSKKSLGDEAGDPLKNPYCIEWEHKPDETEIQKKFDATRLELVRPTQRILDLINGPSPTIEKLVAPFSNKEVRTLFEKHALIDLPWDQFFPISEDERPTAAEVAAMTDELVACDDCGTAMKVTDAVCSSCGKVYEIEQQAAPPPPPPPPPPLAKRSASIAKPAQPAPAPMPPATQSAPKSAPVTLPDDDDLPF